MQLAYHTNNNWHMYNRLNGSVTQRQNCEKKKRNTQQNKIETTTTKKIKKII